MITFIKSCSVALTFSKFPLNNSNLGSMNGQVTKSLFLKPAGSISGSVDCIFVKISTLDDSFLGKFFSIIVHHSTISVILNSRIQSLHDLNCKTDIRGDGFDAAFGVESGAGIFIEALEELDSQTCETAYGDGDGKRIGHGNIAMSVLMKC